jgi:MATE family multidrug resistance protein
VVPDRKKKYLNLTNESSVGLMLKRIILIAIPASVQLLVVYLQVTTDMAFVSRYNPLGLSAIVNVRASYTMLFAFFLGFVNGIRILTSQLLGAEKGGQAKKAGVQSLIFNQLISLGFLLFWQVGGRFLLSQVGAMGEILEFGWTYLRIMSLILLFQGFFMTASSLLQGSGNTLPIAISSIIRTGLNIPLNWLLIFGHGGFPELGIAGAALATLTSELAGGIYLLICLRKNSYFTITATDIREHIKELIKGVETTALFGKVASLGIPMGLEAMACRVGAVGTLALLNRVDPTAAGGYGIIQTIQTLNVSLYHGLGVATMTLVGMAYGGGKNLLARRISLITLLFALTICFLFAVIFFLFPEGMLSIYITDQGKIKELAPLLGIISLTLFPQALNIICGSSLLARGEAKWFLKVQLVGTVVLIANAYLAMIHLNLGLSGLLWAVFIDELWRGSANGLRLRYVSG